MDTQANDITELISAKRLKKRVEELAEEICGTVGGEEITAVCVLKGALMFMTDTIRHLKLPLNVEFMQVRSYEGTGSTGNIEVLSDVGGLCGKNVVVFEDIIDTGATLDFLQKHLAAKAPKRLLTCVLLDNPARRTMPNITPDFTGFIIPNKFVVGYGLDYEQKYRNLPYIGTIDGGKENEQ